MMAGRSLGACWSSRNCSTGLDAAHRPVLQLRPPAARTRPTARKALGASEPFWSSADDLNGPLWRAPGASAAGTWPIIGPDCPSWALAKEVWAERVRLKHEAEGPDSDIWPMVVLPPAPAPPAPPPRHAPVDTDSAAATTTSGSTATSGSDSDDASSSAVEAGQASASQRDWWSMPVIVQWLVDPYPLIVRAWLRRESIDPQPDDIPLTPPASYAAPPGSIPDNMFTHGRLTEAHEVAVVLDTAALHAGLGWLLADVEPSKSPQSPMEGPAHGKPVPVLGIDLEWDPCYTRGQRSPLALLQLAGPSRCLLVPIIRLKGMATPAAFQHATAPLVALLTRPDLVVASVGWSGDEQRGLVEALGVGREDMPGLVDVQAAAKACGAMRLSLNALVTHLLGAPPGWTKGSMSITKSKWSRHPLSDAQISYAAADAFFAAAVFVELRLRLSGGPAARCTGCGEPLVGHATRATITCTAEGCRTSRGLPASYFGPGALRMYARHMAAKHPGVAADAYEMKECELCGRVEFTRAGAAEAAAPQARRLGAGGRAARRSRRG